MPRRYAEGVCFGVVIPGMVFIWYGGRCLAVEERLRGEAPRTALFFPQTKTSRARTLEEKANVIVSDPHLPRPKSEAFFVVAPGEYDVAGFAVRGIALDPRNGEHPVAYVIVSGGLSCCILAFESPSALHDHEVEAIGDVDVLAWAFSDNRDRRAGPAFGDMVRATGARIALPLLEHAQSRSALAREFGVEVEHAEKFAVTAKDIPEEGVRLVFLDAQ